MNFIKLISTVVLFGCIAFLISGVTTFFTGFHNIDLAFNIDRINECSDFDLVDVTLEGDILTPSQLHAAGLIQIKQGLFILTLSLLVAIIPIINLNQTQETMKAK